MRKNRMTWALLLALSLQAAAVELTRGVSLEAALAELTTRGHRIVYSSALVRPEMQLRTAPAATRIDVLLEEILAPWQLRAVQAANGDWLIVAAPPPPVISHAQSEAESAQETPLETVDVTASRYALAAPGASALFLDRRGVEQMPHLADDAVRMLKVLPGVTGGDFSAALNIRGGRREEAQLLIDGAEIHNGFHFRDLDGALSVLDTNLVEGIDFITGGMTAEYGDYMSGVIDMRTRRPRHDDEYHSAAGISFVSAYARTGHSYADGRGAWLASVRRGYLDVVMERVQDDDERITPRYTDMFASWYHDLGERTTISAHTLFGNDDLQLVSSDDDEIDSDGDGRAGHLWLTLEHGFSDALQSRTLLLTSEVRQRRDAFGVDEQRSGDVRADFQFKYTDLRSDWSWRFREGQLLKFGFIAGSSDADYDYALVGAIVDPLAPGGSVDVSHAHDLRVSGRKLGAHAAWRSRIADELVVEAGARWDRYRFDDLHFAVVSPRLNAVYELGAANELRAAWGVIHQPQGIHELPVEDNVTEFHRPERVSQSVLGYLHRFGNGLSLRADVYRKAYSRLRPRFENALDPLQLIPEGALDRVRIDAPIAHASGVEVTVRREAERGLAGWMSLALARAREKVRNEGWTPRSWEQRTSASLGASWTGAKWNVNLAGLFHSGAPTTRIGIGTAPLPGGGSGPVMVAGPRNGARLGTYARLDLRASRGVQLRMGRFSYYLEVTNLLNRKNPCCVESWNVATDEYGFTSLAAEKSNWLPMLPSFGFQFEF
jgi:hypothetical protein